MRLSVFIREHQEQILQEWEDFARTIEPPAFTMDTKELRDHAVQMLDAIADDLDTSQTRHEQDEKSKGRGGEAEDDSAAEIHAVARLLSGYSIEQLVSEYRALRASVLHLWAAASKESPATDPYDVTRFNESIDQALAESVKRYALLVKQGQNFFLAILGHDLRNPLGATISGANLLMLAKDVDSRYTAIATRIFNSGHRMNKLVDDMIDYTRAQLGQALPIAPMPVDVLELCHQVVEEMRLLHPSRTIAFDATSKVACIWDEGRIAQVVSNLIGNAVQHGSASGAILLQLTENNGSGSGDEVMISVTNQGKPIADQEISSIFDPLVRFSNVDVADKTRNTSLGLGLFIAREIALAHGGSIEVKSTADTGTTFELRLPRTASSDTR